MALSMQLIGVQVMKKLAYSGSFPEVQINEKLEGYTLAMVSANETLFVLSGQRNPDEPRHFKNVETVLKMAKSFGINKATIHMNAHPETSERSPSRKAHK